MAVAVAVAVAVVVVVVVVVVFFDMLHIFALREYPWEYPGGLTAAFWFCSFC